MELVFDIEANGFLFEADTIWCIVAIDENDKVYSFRPEQIEEGIKFLQSADKLIGHNIIGYDIPLIKKLYDINLYDTDKVLDTLTISRLANPVREGGHSIEKWGYRLGGVQKQVHEDWTQFSEEMLTRCIKDVKINKTLFNYLKKECVGFSKDSILLEHETTNVLQTQHENGFLFDEKEAMLLLSKLNKRKSEVETEVHETFKPKWVNVKEVKPKLKKDGTLSKSGLTEIEYSERVKTNDVSVFMRKELKEFNLGSRQQIGEYLKDFGWKPKNFTPTGQPIVDESTLNKVKHIKEASLIAEFLLLQKRAAQVSSWIDALQDDGRVHGSVICTGAITGRMAHRSPNMAQVPAIYSPYGKECRACWTVPDGYKLVGVDASGLELRMLAHYMADEEYINEIINGDIHTANQTFAGLKSRDEAKTFIYALIYGAGDEKIGSIINGSRADGKLLRERFLSSLPTLAALKTRVDIAAEKKFLKGLDGRKIFLRHKHAALNTLLQGGGAILMKKGLVILDKRLRQSNLDFKFVGNIHDEWQIEVRACQANRVGQLAVESIIDAGKYYNLRCPMDGEYKIGENWSETH
jgi:DNA polymerase I-like protein with 3'-5' exonuclease and polymerase domains